MFDRLELNKQIQQLEGYLLDVDRQKSHFSASTASHTFQCETPKSIPQRIDPIKFNVQALHDESGGYEFWNSPSVSFSSVDRFGASSCPVREPFIPKVVEVNYIEGSIDPKWSTDNFPWTKKLEVCI